MWNLPYCQSNLIKPAINNLMDIPFELNYQLARLCGINIINNNNNNNYNNNNNDMAI